MKHGVLVVGRVIDVEHRKGSFADRKTGEEISYDFHLAHVLAGRRVVEVRIQKDGPVGLPPVDADMAFAVSLEGKKIVALEAAPAADVFPAARRVASA